MKAQAAMAANSDGRDERSDGRCSDRLSTRSRVVAGGLNRGSTKASDRSPDLAILEAEPARSSLRLCRTACSCCSSHRSNRISNTSLGNDAVSSAWGQDWVGVSPPSARGRPTARVSVAKRLHDHIDRCPIKEAWVTLHHEFEGMDFVVRRGSPGQTELLGVEGTGRIGCELSNRLDISSAPRPIRFAKAQQLGTAHPRQAINIGPEYR